MEKQIKIIVETHPYEYVAYPLGLKGLVVGQHSEDRIYLHVPGDFSQEFFRHLLQ